MSKQQFDLNLKVIEIVYVFLPVKRGEPLLPFFHVQMLTSLTYRHLPYFVDKMRSVMATKARSVAQLQKVNNINLG